MVGEIQRLTEVEHWRHIASPDTLSRGINPYDLIEAERWWNGPEFLKWEHWLPSFRALDNDLPEKGKNQWIHEMSIAKRRITRNLLKKNNIRSQQNKLLFSSSARVSSCGKLSSRYH